MIISENGKYCQVTWVLEVESIDNVTNRKYWQVVAECATERAMKSKYKWLCELHKKGVFKGDRVQWRRQERVLNIEC